MPARPRMRALFGISVAAAGMFPALSHAAPPPDPDSESNAPAPEQAPKASSPEPPAAPQTPREEVETKGSESVAADPETPAEDQISAPQGEKATPWPRLTAPPIAPPSAYSNQPLYFDSAEAWRRWAIKERATLKSEKKQLKAELKELKDPSLPHQKIRLKTQRDQLENKLKRALRKRDPVSAKQLRKEIATIDEQLLAIERQEESIKRVKMRLQATRGALSKTRNFKIFPVVGPAYTPELGFLIAGGALMSWSPEPHNPDLPRSSFPFTVGYTSTNAIVANGRLTSFWLDDRLRVYAELWLKDMADNYWGVGYDAAKGPSDPNESTAYQRLWWWINPTFLARLGVPGLYGGLNVDFNFTGADDVSPEMAADPTFQEFGANNFNGGVGPVLQYDTRDVPQNAWSGIFAQAMFSAYGPYLGGDNRYQVLSLDYRHYLPILRDGSTLAFQARTRMGFGEMPWGEMGMVGSPFDLRGYQWGRYRDKSIFFALAEYRYTFKRFRPAPDGRILSRHGFVVWGGAGTLGEDISEWTKWLPNAGVGYRAEVQPRMNLRLDVGVGNDTVAFYFNFNEAF